MSNAPESLRYTKEHEWVRVEEDGLLVIGITDHAQDSLGDITFVDLPRAGNRFGNGEVFGVVESVKAASDLFLPLVGEVVEVNDSLDASPEKVNTDPYGEGWMVKMKADDPASVDSLLSAGEYLSVL